MGCVTELIASGDPVRKGESVVDREDSKAFRHERLPMPDMGPHFEGEDRVMRRSCAIFSQGTRYLII